MSCSFSNRWAAEFGGHNLVGEHRAIQSVDLKGQLGRDLHSDLEIALSGLVS
jgi:hypothetical protein